MTNTEFVQLMYGAFSRGDIPAILDYLAEDVAWEYGEVSTDIPWLQPRRGRADVANFFQSLSLIEFEVFNPKAFFADQDIVISLVDVIAAVKSTGKRVVEIDQVHIFHFNSQGKVQKFRHRVDTHLQWLAIQS